MPRRFLVLDNVRLFGDWHLTSMTDDENMPSQHHMDLRFKESSGELKGAIVSRRDGTETSLASAQFDGSTLRLKMVAPPGTNGWPSCGCFGLHRTSKARGALSRRAE
jgi:hypothetical protein